VITSSLSALTGRPRDDTWLLCLENNARISALLSQE
jgi:hypothetical protein